MNVIRTLAILSAMLVLAACGGSSVIGTGEDKTSDPVTVDGNPFGPPSVCWEDTDGRNCAAFAIKGPTGCEPTLGVCSLFCSSDAECPYADKEKRFGSVCRNPVPSDSPAICVIPCDKGQPCPDDMVCGQVTDGIAMCFFERNCTLPPYCTSDASAE